MDPSISKITEDPIAASQGFAPDDVRGFVRWAARRYGAELALALSLGVEDTILLHFLDEAASELGVVPKVFTLDTGRLPNESYELLERLRDRYRLPIATYFPQATSVEALYQKKGPLSFYDSVENRKECCAIRKVEPLGRALAGSTAWLTGLRRVQSPTRTLLERVEREPDRMKLSPLVHLDDDQTWALAKALDVPLHALHARGYPSIGCAPCTRAVQAGEPSRAGRWWWEDPSLKECGIHTRTPR